MRRQFKNKGGIKLHDKELLSAYSSPNIIKVVKSRNIMLTTRINLGRNDIRNAALVVGSEWKGQVGGNE
jgi:cobalamin biosynthesis Co2+ chelatase CbiK